MLLHELEKKKLIQPPSWLASNCHFLTYFGSVAYGVSSDTSDCDIYGWCIPPKDMVFPHLRNEILGFGKQIKRFEQFQMHHILDKDALGGKGRNYDVSVYGIVKYFDLLLNNNPNVLETIYVPINCIIHSTQIANLVRENRKMFLHKGSYYKTLGYAHSMLHKMITKNPEGKRKELIEKFGFDTKYAYNLVRLAYEARMILEEHDLDLQRNKEHLKAIRRGEIKEEEIREWFAIQEKELEKLYYSSTLRHSPDEEKIKQLLLHCLEMHYGSLEKCIANQNQPIVALKEIQEILNKNRNLLI